MSVLFWFAGIVVIIFGIVVLRGAPYVPSQRRYAKTALTKLYQLKPNDVLVDMGSGDGVILRIASDLGARAIGYELNPILVFVSKLLSRGDAHQTTKMADMWLTDLPKETTVVYVFPVSRDGAKLTEKLQRHVEKTGQVLWCITYGPHLKNKEPIKTLQAHKLYRFTPQTLHADKA